MRKPNFSFERKLWNKNIKYVIGIDEVGRGAFAGPIVAAGVAYRKNFQHPVLDKINDSKLLKPKIREELCTIIKKQALIWTIESIEVPFINKYGIGKANSAVFRKVLKKLFSQMKNDLNHFILIDGFHVKYLPGGVNKQKAIIEGDQKSLSISSASIIAKVYRDELMKRLGKEYKGYNFPKNKGYGTKYHREALKKHGLSKIHRKSFNLDKFLSSTL